MHLQGHQTFESPAPSARHFVLPEVHSHVHASAMRQIELKEVIVSKNVFMMFKIEQPTWLPSQTWQVAHPIH